MAANYYEPYKIYDTSLSKGTGIVQKSSSLKSSCINYSNTIKSNFINKVSNTNWSEEGKNVVESNIFPGLESNIQDLTDFISNNLYKACDISINHLLPKVIMIKEKNIELDETEKKLIKTKNDLDTLKKQEPSATKTDDATGEEIVNPDYEEWVAEVNTLTTTYNELVTKFQNLIILLENLCLEANKLIEKILLLNENLSVEEIASMLPSIPTTNLNDYSYIINNYVSIDDLELYLTGNLDILEYEEVTNRNGQVLYSILTLSNGKKLPIFRQGSQPSSLKLKNGKTLNIKANGCSILSATSSLIYLTQNFDITVNDVANAMGDGGYDPLEKLFSGSRTIKINGINYTVSSDISEKLNPRKDKAFTIDNWYTTLTNGGVVVFNTAKTAIDTNTITVGDKNMNGNEITNLTGIKSNGGHVLVMTGIDKNNEVIFADSVYINGKETHFSKGLTLDDLYNVYMKGPTGTKITDDNRRNEVMEYYYTINNAKLVQKSI